MAGKIRPHWISWQNVPGMYCNVIVTFVSIYQTNFATLPPPLPMIGLVTGTAIQ